MNRRESLKIISLTASSALLLDACSPKQDVAAAVPNVEGVGRQPFEVKRDQQLLGEKFFSEHEMATITVLVDIIIPKDDRSGSATDAKVPEFIEFIVKDEPQHQLPMRGGLRWLDVKCLNLYNNDFKNCTPKEQESILNEIAFPSTAKPEMQAGVSFFNKIRDLTAIGFFTSKMGVDDLGYKGNSPTIWKGVPADIIQRYGLQGV